MLLNATKLGKSGKFGSRSGKRAKNKRPEREEYVKSRDYTGAIALLEFNQHAEDFSVETSMWLGYCAAHLGDYKKALEAFEEIEKRGGAGKEIHLYMAICMFFLQMYAEAEAEALEGPSCGLQNRLLFHISHKTNEEKKLMKYHQKLTESKEDQLSLAAIHYLRNHYQEATDIYKQLLLQHRDDLALNVYVAMCYYKLDYYDVSLEILAVYLQSHPDSAIAINLKACNHFRLYNGKAAEAELKALQEQGHALHDNDLIRHNLVVFRNGENALKVLPGLIDFLPEARLNLVIYHLKNNDIEEAYELMKEVEPGTPQEYVLKGVVNATLGQVKNSREHLKKAQQFFQLVGASQSECDTIPGRQCMASCFFLLRQFEDVNIYLNSIKAYLYNDDDFNFNYGVSLCSTGQYVEAEETLQLVQDEEIRGTFEFLSHLARAQIRGNKRSQQAWELYLKMETSTDSFGLLELIANDCYKVGEFFYAAKAASTLFRLEGDAHTMWWEALRGASCGVLAKVISREFDPELLSEVLKMLRNISNPQVEYIMRVITKYCNENAIDVD